MTNSKKIIAISLTAICGIFLICCICSVVYTNNLENKNYLYISVSQTSYKSNDTEITTSENSDYETTTDFVKPTTSAVETTITDFSQTISTTINTTTDIPFSQPEITTIETVIISTTAPSTEITTPVKPTQVDINNADLDQLTTLSGIGEVIGQRIIDYRNENGGFSSLEQIKNVTGIGDKIYEKILPFIYIKDANPTVTTAKPSENKSEIVNINTATLEQLMTLKGIGEKIGQRILDYRSENGDFISINELKEVKGIGDKVFANIEKYIKV